MPTMTPWCRGRPTIELHTSRGQGHRGGDEVSERSIAHFRSGRPSLVSSSARPHVLFEGSRLTKAGREARPRARLGANELREKEGTVYVREDGSGSIVTSEPGLAHSRPVVDNLEHGDKAAEQERVSFSSGGVCGGGGSELGRSVGRGSELDWKDGWVERGFDALDSKDSRGQQLRRPYIAHIAHTTQERTITR